MNLARKLKIGSAVIFSLAIGGLGIRAADYFLTQDAQASSRPELTIPAREANIGDSSGIPKEYLRGIVNSYWDKNKEVEKEQKIKSKFTEDFFREHGTPKKDLKQDLRDYGNSRKIKEIKAEKTLKIPYLNINNLVGKIIQIESSGDPFAHNKKENARGLMQIRPAVLEEWNQAHPNEQYTPEDLFNPKVNVKMGTWFIQKKIRGQYLPHYGLDPHKIENIVASYNWGPTVHGKFGDARENREALPKTTQDYLAKLGI